MILPRGTDQLLLPVNPIFVWFTLLISTLFFIFISGRMGPAMALITSSVAPEQRGRFMSFNTAVQQGYNAILGPAAPAGFQNPYYPRLGPFEAPDPYKVGW